MAMRHEELAGFDAARCVALVRAGELTTLELVEAARAPSGAGIFAGTPFLVKDLLAEVV